MAVGRAVGTGVGSVAVGLPPGPRTGGVGVTAGGAVGVGPTATMGLLGTGVTDGSTDGGIEGPTAIDPLGCGALGTGDPDALVGCDGPDVRDPEGVAVSPDGETEALPAGAADGLPAMIPDPSGAGATNPAVSATVASTRLRRPMATTRRARWAEVTTTDGLLQAGQLGVLGDGPMVAPGLGIASIRSCRDGLVADPRASAERRQGALDVARPP